MTALPKVSVLVRTWFGDEHAWDALVREIQTPSEDGFLAYVTLVDDPAFEGMDADALRAGQPDGPFVSFLADKTTLTDAEHPILAVSVYRDEEAEPFRVIPAVLWGVENNLNLANMDWDEFAGATENGVFRGF